jgi:hypothetical protein
MERNRNNTLNNINSAYFESPFAADFKNLSGLNSNGSLKFFSIRQFKYEEN